MRKDIADGAYKRDALIDIGKYIKNMPYGGTLNRVEEDRIRKTFLNKLDTACQVQPKQGELFKLCKGLHKFIWSMSIGVD